MKTWKPILIAGLGGLMPTLARLATTYATDPTAPMPEAGLYMALGLFFFIGAVVAGALGESNPRQAFVLGISAPAIITNLMMGVSEGRVHREGLPDLATAPIPTASLHIESGLQRLLENLGLSTAHAQLPSAPQVSSSSSSRQARACPGDIRAVSINVSAAGDAGQLAKAPELNLQFLRSDGSVERNLSLAIGKSTTVAVTSDATSVVFRAGAVSGRQQLPEHASGVLTLTARVAAKNDFLWALGGRRAFDVVAVDSAWQSTERVASAAQSADLLGKWVVTEWAGEYAWDPLRRYQTQLPVSGELWIHPAEAGRYSGLLVLCIGEKKQRIVEVFNIGVARSKILMNGRVIEGRVIDGRHTWDDDVLSMTLTPNGLTGYVDSQYERDKPRVSFARAP